MSDVFEFRDFSMLQASVGQRINTDSCVFAALVGDESRPPRRILDIGAGTGVVTLMLSLRFPAATLTAVEPESSIAAVARTNFSQVAWRDRFALLEDRIQDLDAEQCGVYDLVLCNPPYFQNGMLSADRITAMARHNADLSINEIYQAMLRLMADGGSAWLSFPADDADLWLSEGRVLGLHPTEYILVSDHANCKPHIVVVGWSRLQPTIMKERALHYRTSLQGPLSPWMQEFRKRWFPARFNKNMYAVDG